MAVPASSNTLPRESVDQGLFPGGRMDAIPLFSWGQERMHAKPLHLSSGRQVSSSLAADVATGSSQSLVLAQCGLPRKMCILRAVVLLAAPLVSSPQLTPGHPQHLPYQGTTFQGEGTMVFASPAWGAP